MSSRVGGHQWGAQALMEAVLAASLFRNQVLRRGGGCCTLGFGKAVIVQLGSVGPSAQGHRHNKSPLPSQCVVLSGGQTEICVAGAGWVLGSSSTSASMHRRA